MAEANDQRSTVRCQLSDTASRLVEVVVEVLSLIHI